MMTAHQRLEQIATLEHKLRAERDKVVELRGHIFGAVMAAVHDGRPCPWCEAPTTNMHPYGCT